MFVPDLKTQSGICKPSRRIFQRRSAHVYRPAHIYPSHGLYAVENLSALRGAVSRQLQCQELLYKQRWQVELFFKWIKQHLRIKSFFGTSENAVKTQICIAVSVYLIVAIIKKRLNLQESLYTILQVLSISLFERASIDRKSVV